MPSPDSGNSKYHYYGIRVKPESPLNNLADEVSLLGRPSGGRGSRARREEYQDGGIDMHQTQVGAPAADTGGARGLQWSGTVAAPFALQRRKCPGAARYAAVVKMRWSCWSVNDAL